MYANSAERWRPNRLPRTEEADAIYTNSDNDPRGDWLPGDPYANKPYSKGQYSITGPTGRTFSPPPGRFWRVSEDRLREFDEDGRIWWGPNGDARPSIKRYLSEVADLVPRTLWSKDQVGSNRTSKNEMRALFPDVEAFATPKPERLMLRTLHIGSTAGDIVIDRLFCRLEVRRLRWRIRHGAPLGDHRMGTVDSGEVYPPAARQGRSGRGCGRR